MLKATHRERKKNVGKMVYFAKFVTMEEALRMSNGTVVDVLAVVACWSFDPQLLH